MVEKKRGQRESCKGGNSGIEKKIGFKGGRRSIAEKDIREICLRRMAEKEQGE